MTSIEVSTSCRSVYMCRSNCSGTVPLGLLCPYPVARVAPVGVNGSTLLSFHTREGAPPPGEDLKTRLADLLAWSNVSHRPHIDPFVEAAMAHYTFEALHPFHDGNGRLGRLFVVLHLHRLGVLSEPSITVSPWFEDRRASYYDALLGVSTEGDWSTWVSLFAQGLATSADRAREHMLALTDVQGRLKQRVRESSLRSANARLLIDFATATPTFTVRQVADHLGIQRSGAKRLVDSLVSLQIIDEFGKSSYDRRFHSPEIIRILLTTH